MAAQYKVGFVIGGEWKRHAALTARRTAPDAHSCAACLTASGDCGMTCLDLFAGSGMACEASALNAARSSPWKHQTALEALRANQAITGKKYQSSGATRCAISTARFVAILDPPFASSAACRRAAKLSAVLAPGARLCRMRALAGLLAQNSSKTVAPAGLLWTAAPDRREFPLIV